MQRVARPKARVRSLVHPTWPFRKGLQVGTATEPHPDLLRPINTAVQGRVLLTKADSDHIET